MRGTFVRIWFYFITLCLVLTLAACNFPLLKDQPASTGIQTPLIIYITATPSGYTPTPGNNTPQPLTENDGVFTYHAQSGDTLAVVARHFGVSAGQITSPQTIDPTGVLTPGQPLLIPDVLNIETTSPEMLPDSEFVFSPTAADFDVEAYVAAQGGFLSSYGQEVNDVYLTGAQIVERVAVSNSINPRLLLALIEYRSGWVSGFPAEPDITYPLRFYYKDHQGFYLECALMAKWLNTGYYGWREGLFSELTLTDGTSIRVEPQLNAGTVALQYLFSQVSSIGTWEHAIHGSTNVAAFYSQLFGDPWARAAAVEPVFTAAVNQPQLELPFVPGTEWAVTGGIHYDWNAGTPMGALDFAPITGEPPCSVSRAWVLAPAPGRISFSAYNMVILDVYNDQGQPTGWQFFYMHIADQGRIAAGSLVALDEEIGHPSCEGGASTGTHVHVARRYMGEWIGSGAPYPFVLGGWTAIAGDQQYLGTLVNGDRVVTAKSNGSAESWIIR